MGKRDILIINGVGVRGNELCNDGDGVWACVDMWSEIE